MPPSTPFQHAARTLSCFRTRGGLAVPEESLPLLLLLPALLLLLLLPPPLVLLLPPPLLLLLLLLPPLLVLLLLLPPPLVLLLPPSLRDDENAPRHGGAEERFPSALGPRG